jgi:hypothetical protein
MKKKPESIDLRILRSIKGHSKGWVFTPGDFSDLGSRDAVASALKRYKQAGVIRQLARGLYDYPRVDPELGVLHPSMDEIAKVVAGRGAIRIQPSGAYAANLLGLSTQMPMKRVYLTDGTSRVVRIGKQEIVLRKTSPKHMATAGKISGLVIQALRHLGREQVDEAVVAVLGRRLDRAARKQLMKDIRYAPAWIAAIIRELGQAEGGEE